MRKFFTFFALAAMTLSMSAQTVYTDATTGLNFEITGTNTAKIVAGDYSAMDELEFSTVKQGTTTYKVTEIGDRVFKNCKYLVAFAMDDDNTPVTIGEEAFAGCESLEMCIIFNCVEIKKKAFVGCTVLDGEGFDKIQIVGDSAFVGCSSMAAHWFFSNNRNTLTSIGANAFEGCSIGKGVKWLLELGSSKVSQLHIGKDAFKNLTDAYIISLSGPTVITYDGNVSPFDGIKEQIEEIRLSNSLVSIPAKFFAGMSNAMIQTNDGTNIGATLDNLKTIGDSAFAGCTGMDNSAINHIFGSKLTTIGADAFSGCSAVTSFALPASLTTIGDRAFAGLSNLAQITANMTTPPAINANVFADCGNLGMIKLKVSDANYNTYKAANVWKNFKLLRQSGLWTISFSGHDINKATIKVLNAANDEVLDESQITDGTTVKFEITPAPGYINKQNPEPMVITGDEYIVVDMYAITYRKRFIAQDGHGYFTFKKNGVDYDPELDNMNYGIYEYGTILSVTAHANEGYKFVQWSNSSTNPTYSISFTAAIPSPDNYYFDATHFTYKVIREDTKAVFEVDPATGVDNTAAEGKAVKRMVNGQLLIEREGKVYNALGAEIK